MVHKHYELYLLDCEKLYTCLIYNVNDAEEMKYWEYAGYFIE